LGDDVKKTWQSALRDQAARKTTSLLTFAESEQRLDELLPLRFQMPEIIQGK